MQNAHNSQIIM